MTIPLIRKNEVMAYALIDDKDYSKIEGYKWTLHRGYAQAPHNKTTVFMHRLIVDAKKGEITDHINGNTLDNRQENLRIANSAQNSWNRRLGKRNTSGYKGVWKGGKHNPHRWRAAIQKGGKYMHLGYYATAEEAAQAYDKAAIKIYGAYASLNGGSSSA